MDPVAVAVLPAGRYRVGGWQGCWLSGVMRSERLAGCGFRRRGRAGFGLPLPSVSHGGLLTALPALLQEGLLSCADALSLPKGFHGPRSVLLTLAFTLLARSFGPRKLRRPTLLTAEGCGWPHPQATTHRPTSHSCVRTRLGFFHPEHPAGG